MCVALRVSRRETAFDSSPVPLHPPNQKHWRMWSDTLMILLEGILFACFVYFVVNSDCMDAAQRCFFALPCFFPMALAAGAPGLSA
jgi:hypothetical protein